MSDGKKNIEVLDIYEDIIPWDVAHPERNLLRAMLITAMADIEKKGEVGRKAREYFLNPDQRYIFSFRSVCTLLDVSPEAVMNRLGLKSESEIDAR